MRHVKDPEARPYAELLRKQQHQQRWQQLQQECGTNKDEFARVAALIELAQTVQEVQSATDELRSWVRSHPEDKERLSDVFSVLFTLEEGAREAQAEAEAMRLSGEEIRERENLTLLCRDVRGEDSPDVFRLAHQEARRALEAWAVRHPEDPQIPSLSAYLDVQEEIAGLLSAAS